MSHPVWPEQLVKFERSGWQLQPQDARRRRQGEAGPPAYRRRFSAAAKVVSLALVVDRDGKAVFDRFYEVDCALGSRLFWMPDPSTSGWPLLASTGEPLLMPDDTPLLVSARWLCSFGEDPPVETMVGDVEFRKAFSIAVMP